MVNATLLLQVERFSGQVETDVESLAEFLGETGRTENVGKSDRHSKVQPKILIIDDELLTSELTRLHLWQEGYTNVEVIQDVTGVMDHISSKCPDIILLDLYMPGIGGLQVLQAIRSDQRLVRTSVIMMTASSEHDDKLDALKLGATDFLSKPVHPGELVVRIRNILKARAYEDQLRSYERQKRLEAEQELQTAERIQSHLFPKSAPLVPGIDLAGRAYSAGNGCGDYFDFFTLANEQIGLVVGDVTGHGMPSALRMMETRAYLRSLVRFQTDPGGMLTELNQFMIREAAYGGDGTEQFMTLFLATIDPDTRELIYASAGHVGYLLRRSGTLLKLNNTGFPLGIFDLSYETSPVLQLEPGDTLIIATDGIEESMNRSGEQFGASRLASTVRSCQPFPASAIITQVYSTVGDFTEGIRQRDDITIIVAVIDEEP